MATNKIPKQILNVVDACIDCSVDFCTEHGLSAFAEIRASIYSGNNPARAVIKEAGLSRADRSRVVGLVAKTTEEELLW